MGELTMKRKLLIASALTVVVVAVGGSAVAWASGSWQEAPPMTGNSAAMHGACVSGNSQAMRAAMENLTEEDWQAMGAYMRDGNHGGMMGGSPHSGMGDMMGAGFGPDEVLKS